MQASPIRNNTLDIFRLIACFFIITLHISYSTASAPLAGIYRLAGRFGVLFFFLLSGYFYQKSLEKSAPAAFRKNFFKIFNIIVIANLVYIPRTYILTHHLYPLEDITIGNCFNLWYLYALLIGLTAVYLLFRWKANLLIVSGIIFFIIVALILTDSHSYLSGINNPAVFKYYVRPFISIPFMLIGGLFYKNDKLKSIIREKTGVIMLLAGFIIQIIEAVLINWYTHKPLVIHQFLIGTVIYSVGVFIVALSLNLKNTVLSRFGKRYALFIYLYHPVFITFLDFSNYTAVFNGNIILLFPVPIFFITLFTGIFIDKYIPSLFLVLTGSIKQAFTKKSALDHSRI